MTRQLFEKRQQPHGTFANILLIFLSILLALIVGAGLIAMAGVGPIEAYRALFYGAFGRVYGLVDTLVKGTPLLLAGLGLAIAFKASVWNVGAEGQIYMGALAAVWVGLNVSGVPTWIHLPLALLAGAIGGGLWALIPGLLKAYLKVNEVIVSLMLNYIAILFVSWLVHGPMEEPGGFMPQTPRVAKTAQLPLLFPPTRLHAGVLVALGATLLVYFMLFHTSLGYRIRAVGANPKAARFGGIEVERSIVLVMFLSGTLAGLAGANEVLGIHYRLLDGISPGYGFTAMVVALLGKLHPLGVVAASYLFASLTVGADMMQKIVHVPIALSRVIQGLVVLCVLGTDILLMYDFVPLRRSRQEPAGESVGEET
ncbi:MAG: ABC transporter permease [Chloroflexota bacterium]|nr:MAG: ABC transporter permease [Chloroflexota bacterium]